MELKEKHLFVEDDVMVKTLDKYGQDINEKYKNQSGTYADKDKHYRCFATGNKMTPKEKALNEIEWETDEYGSSVDMGSVDKAIEKAIEETKQECFKEMGNQIKVATKLALKEQAKVYDEMIMKAPLGLINKTILLNIIKHTREK